MEKFIIELYFRPMKKDFGELEAAEGRDGKYCIDISVKQSKLEQIKTCYHEFTHLVSDLFYGARHIKGDEERFCRDVEKAVEKVIKKHVREEVVIKLRPQRKRKRRKKHGKSTNKN